MNKANFHYGSAEDYQDDYDDDDQYYDEEEDYDDEYYDDGEDLQDEDFIRTGPQKPNGPKAQNNKKANDVKTTIYNKKVSNFEKRLLTLFKFQKMQILQYLDNKSIHKLYLCCKMIKDTLGQFLWSTMCLKDYNLYLETIKDLPENLPYYLYFSLKKNASPFDLLDETKFTFLKPSKKLTDAKKFYLTTAFTVHEQKEQTLQDNYGISFITKKYLLNRLDQDEKVLTFCELSYDLKFKQILKITLPENYSLVDTLSLSGNVIQLNAKDCNDPDKLNYFYINVSKFFEEFKRKTATLNELSFAKVRLLMHEDPHYYSHEDDITQTFSVNLAQKNEIIIKYKNFETQFRERIMLDGINLLCLVDTKRPLLLFINYTKPKLVKIYPLKNLKKIQYISCFKKSLIINIEDVTSKKVKITLAYENGQYVFNEESSE